QQMNLDIGFLFVVLLPSWLKTILRADLAGMIVIVGTLKSAAKDQVTYVAFKVIGSRLRACYWDH
ncbi:hypothetical protein MPER_10862, partial [Moniliophthora perniciosa FA553]